jgi:hypothetical protein
LHCGKISRWAEEQSSNTAEQVLAKSQPHQARGRSLRLGLDMPLNIGQIDGMPQGTMLTQVNTRAQTTF